MKKNTPADSRAAELRRALLSLLYRIDSVRDCTGEISVGRRAAPQFKADVLAAIAAIESAAGPLNAWPDLKVETVRLILRESLLRIEGMKPRRRTMGANYQWFWWIVERAGLFRDAEEWRGNTQELHAALTDPNNGLTEKERRQITGLEYLVYWLDFTRRDIGGDFINWSRPEVRGDRDCIAPPHPKAIWTLNHRAVTAATD